MIRSDSALKNLRSNAWEGTDKNPSIQISTDNVMKRDNAWLELTERLEINTTAIKHIYETGRDLSSSVSTICPEKRRERV